MLIIPPAKAGGSSKYNGIMLAIISPLQYQLLNAPDCFWFFGLPLALASG